MTARSVITALLVPGALSLLLIAAGTASRAQGHARVARGEYLVMIGGCHDCHTPGTFYGAPDFSRQLSGSEVGWRGPWGVTFPRNLTPDRETGLGAWRADDIVRAIRGGVRPDGSRILPPMPWPNYSRLTSEDADAIAAYLKSIPAVRHSVPDRVAPGAPAGHAAILVPLPPPWDAPRGRAPASPSRGS